MINSNWLKAQITDLKMAEKAHCACHKSARTQLLSISGDLK